MAKNIITSTLILDEFFRVSQNTTTKKNVGHLGDHTWRYIRCEIRKEASLNSGIQVVYDGIRRNSCICK